MEEVSEMSIEAFGMKSGIVGMSGHTEDDRKTAINSLMNSFNQLDIKTNLKTLLKLN